VSFVNKKTLGQKGWRDVSRNSRAPLASPFFVRSGDVPSPAKRMHTAAEADALNARTFTCREGEGIAAGPSHDAHEVRVVAIADGHVRLRFSGDLLTLIRRVGGTFTLGGALVVIEAFGKDGCRNVVLTVRAEKEVPVKALKAA
jgi:hypothetical protein